MNRAYGMSGAQIAPGRPIGALVKQSEEILAVGSRSFAFASRFLTRSQRLDAAVVYAFCRAVDDVADEAIDRERARADLAAVREDLRTRDPVIPIVRGFREVAARRGIDLRAAVLLVDGVTSDLGSVRVEDDAALIRYCHMVAGTVGIMMCGVLGVRNARAFPFAIDLGIAMQLTNICRDVAEDAARGRVYLPGKRLRRAGESPEALVSGRADRTRIARVVLSVLELAERYYESADAGMRFIPLVPRAAILVASRLYRGIGRKLAANGGDALAGRTVVSGRQKLGLTAGALAMLFHPRLYGSTEHDAALHLPLQELVR